MTVIGSIIALLMSLALALRALKARELTIERKALYAVIWIVLFIVVAFAMDRIMA